MPNTCHDVAPPLDFLQDIRRFTRSATTFDRGAVGLTAIILSEQSLSFEFFIAPTIIAPPMIALTIARTIA